MSLIDILLFVVIVLSIVAGYHKGFISGTLDLFLLVLGVAFALWASGYITPTGVWTRPLVFIVAYILGRTVLSFLAGSLIRNLPEKTHQGAADKAFGVVPGAVNGIIYVAVISSLLLVLPWFDVFSSKTRESAVVNVLTPHMQCAAERLAPALTVEPTSETTMELPFTVKDPVVREALEAEMLAMINGERKEQGLPALAADPEMRTVARLHSRDMLANGYFSHINKDGETPAQRARKAGVRFLIAGENLAFAQTLRIAHSGLMNSPGHRANILNKSFGRVGIGILDGGKYGLMITQNFRN